MQLVGWRMGGNQFLQWFRAEHVVFLATSCAAYCCLHLVKARATGPHQRVTLVCVAALRLYPVNSLRALICFLSVQRCAATSSSAPQPDGGMPCYTLCSVSSKYQACFSAPFILRRQGERSSQVPTSHAAWVVVVVSLWEAVDRQDP